MDLIRSCYGNLFGDCIPVHFEQDHFQNKYKDDLISNEELDKLDEYFCNPMKYPDTYYKRNMYIKYIEAYFYDEISVNNLLDRINEEHGMDILSRTTYNDKHDYSDYSRNPFFVYYFNLQRITVKYDYGEEERIKIHIHIITPKVTAKYHLFDIMPNITIKQVSWICGNAKIVPDSTSGWSELLDDYINNKVYIREESTTMREAIKNFIYSDPDNLFERLMQFIKHRIITFKRLLPYHRKFTVVNSPLEYTDSLPSEEDTCGICDDVNHPELRHELRGYFRCKTEKNTPYYCFRCIDTYMNMLLVQGEGYSGSTSNVNEFHENPILTPETWSYLTKRQIYIIENIFVDPVGNHANFACTKKL